MNKITLGLKIFLALVIYFMFLDDGIDTAKKEIQRKDWVQGKGMVEEVYLKEKPHSVNKKYITTFLMYSYSIEGKKYYGVDVLDSERLQHVSGTENNLLAKEMKEYPVGKTITLRLNPENKEESTAMPFSDNFVFLLLLGLGAEIVLVLSVFRDWKKSRLKVDNKRV